MNTWKPRNDARESRYERHLSQVAKEIDRITKEYYHPGNEGALYDALIRYRRCGME